ncbi:MAG TPA: hypothetical protein VFX85_06815, partial [Solirubrobacterales bacterium]|nr:hypothetical protein [Solirubrobacterales bacterium]
MDQVHHRRNCEQNRRNRPSSALPPAQTSRYGNQPEPDGYGRNQPRRAPTVGDELEVAQGEADARSRWQ